MKKRILPLIAFVSIVFALVTTQTFAQTQPFPANKTYAYGLMPGNKNSQDALNNYNTWKTNFVEACSNGRYRVKFDDRSQTVSEGIGYGMLLSAYAGDKTLFDGLWNYYKDNRNGNGVMNWKINGCSGTNGANGATDADLDAAMALIVADYQWGTSGAINYKNDAKSLIGSIKNFEIESGSYVVKPGDQFGGSSLTNPSYFAPAYFRTFATYMNDSFWNNVADKCYVVINNNLSVNNAVGGLVSDWCTASGSYSNSAGSYANGGRNYSYDAARTPWRIAVDYAWYGNSNAKTYSKKSSDFVRVNLGGSQNVKDGYTQNGSSAGSNHNSTFVGAFASAAMGGDNQSHLDNSYSDLKGLNDAGSYFNQSLKTLYLFLLSGNFYLPGSAPVTPPVVVTQAPYGSAPATIPGKIEAENYDLGGSGVAYNDATPGNDGGQYRSDDVDIEVTTDAGGGYDIGYTAAGEWIEYTVNVTAAGKYDFAVRVAATATGKSMHIEMNGVNVTGSISIPNTGDWQAWQTVTVPNITLASGKQIMKVVMDTDGFNLNYINVTASVVTPANVAPTVSLTAPANNATYTVPASVTLTANAADSDGSISKVDFYSGSTLLFSDASAPYTYTWTNVAAGTYTITAKATDNSSAVTTSAAVLITVTPPANVAPTVSLTAPANNASFTAPTSVTLTANAADSDGSISKVDFYNGSTLLFSDASAPYTYTWANVAAGTYTITAKATDNSNAVTTSAAITITITAIVTPPANVAPTVSLTAPANNASYMAPASVTLTANAADSDGSISKVDFYNGSTLLFSDASAPYSYTWPNVAAGTYTITAKATDNSSAVTTSAAITITVTAVVTPPANNVAPTVAITTPNNSDYVEPASILLTASAADSDGSVVKVDFYVGSTVVFSDSVAPYSYSWTNVAAGTYVITAQATDDAGATTTSASITIAVTTAPVAPVNGCVSETVPVASQWVVRNSWTDQYAGSKVVTTADALNIKQRAWGNPELWIIETGRSVNVTSGQTYTVSFDFKNDANIPVTGIDVGFATGEEWDAAILVQPAVSVSGSFPSSSYVTKTVTITSTFTGTVYFAAKLKTNVQPSNEVNTYLKNLSVCTSGSTAPVVTPPSNANTAPAAASGFITGPNPFQDQTTVVIPSASDVAVHLIMTNMSGVTVWESYSLQTNQTIYLGSGLPIGIYIVNAYYEGKTSTFRLIKQ